MEDVIVIDATDEDVLAIAEVIAWRFSDLRRNLYAREGILVKPPEKIFVLNPQRARPLPQLVEVLGRTYGRGMFIGMQEEIANVIEHSLKTAITIGCNYWELGRVVITRDEPELQNKDVHWLKVSEEWHLIMERKLDIENQEGISGKSKRELQETLRRSILPEFNRLEFLISSGGQKLEGLISSNTDALEKLGKNIIKGYADIKRRLDKLSKD